LPLPFRLPFLAVSTPQKLRLFGSFLGFRGLAPFAPFLVSLLFVVVVVVGIDDDDEGVVVISAAVEEEEEEEDGASLNAGAAGFPPI
jgi:hypothetical protein